MRFGIIFSLLTSSVVLISCKNTGVLQFASTGNKAVVLNDDVETIAIYNRAWVTPKKGSEKNLRPTPEGLNNEFSEVAVSSLSSKINDSERYKSIICKYPLASNASANLKINESLSWKIVDSLCKINKTSILIVQELFNSNYMPSQDKNQQKSNLKPEPTDKKIRISSAYKIYDLKTRSILFDDTLQILSSALENLIIDKNTQDSIQIKKSYYSSSATLIGNRMANTILGEPTTEKRTYFKSKQVDFKNAEALALDEKWNEAIALWTKVYTSSSNSKVKSKAAHNLAICYEALVDYENAYNWIQTSVNEKNNPISENYLQQLAILYKFQFKKIEGE